MTDGGDVVAILRREVEALRVSTARLEADVRLFVCMLCLAGLLTLGVLICLLVQVGC